MEISKVLDPIGEGQAAGRDVRYDPLFDALQSEVEKLTCPSFAGIVDWEGVVELASDILATKSKDLVVTSYLAVALVHTRHQDGVLTSLRLYHDMLDRFWEELYPAKNKVRGRVLSVEWWLEKTLKALQLPDVRLTAPQAVAALEVVERIDRLLSELLPGAPSVEPLKRFFAEQQHAVTQERRQAEDAAEEIASEGAGRKEGGDSGGAGRGAEGDRDLDGALRSVRRGALLLRREEPENPLPYRLLRVSVWSTVSALPPALEGLSRIAAPDRQQVALLRELRQKHAAEALLESAEARLPEFIFWLDLNRLSFEALGQLGEKYRDAQEAIVQETCHLVRRLPGLLQLAFSDGTPFADADTRRWLEHVSPTATVQRVVAPASLPVEAGEGEGAELSRALEEAQRLSKEGKLSEAVEGLHGKLQGCGSGRERLLWRMALVEFLLNGTGSRLVLPQLDQVLAEVERHALAGYDPALALRALKLAYLGFQGAEDPVFKEKARAALFRIGQLDPAEMVRLEKGAQLC